MAQDCIQQANKEIVGPFKVSALHFDELLHNSAVM